MVHFMLQALVFVGALLGFIIVVGLIIVVVWVMVEEGVDLIKDYKSYKKEEHDEF